MGCVVAESCPKQTLQLRAKDQEEPATGKMGEGMPHPGPEARCKFGVFFRKERRPLSVRNVLGKEEVA